MIKQFFPDSKVVTTAPTLKKIEATLATLEEQRTQFDGDLAQLFGLDSQGEPTSATLGAISWDPPCSPEKWT